MKPLDRAESQRADFWRGSTVQLLRSVGTHLRLEPSTRASSTAFRRLKTTSSDFGSCPEKSKREASAARSAELIFIALGGGWIRCSVQALPFVPIKVPFSTSHRTGSIPVPPDLPPARTERSLSPGRDLDSGRDSIDCSPWGLPGGSPDSIRSSRRDPSVREESFPVPHVAMRKIALFVSAIILVPAVSSLRFFPLSGSEPIRARRTDGNDTLSGSVQFVGGPHRPGQRFRETLSWKPRASLINAFLSEEECDHLIGIAKKKLVRSSVVDPKTGKGRTDGIRTSSGSSVVHDKDAIVIAVEERASRWAHIPPENGETMQILKYERGQKYGSHWDFFESTQPGQGRSGRRIATLLMYLSDVEEGGETAFKYGRPLNEKKWMDQSSGQSPFSECAKLGVAIRPKKGDALFFWDMRPDLVTPDRFSMHDGCPVISGEKWSATIWYRSIPMRASSKSRRHCVDHDSECSRWAALGECYSNPIFMLDKTQSYCPKSCKVC